MMFSAGLLLHVLSLVWILISTTSSTSSAAWLVTSATTSARCFRFPCPRSDPRAANQRSAVINNRGYCACAAAVQSNEQHNHHHSVEEEENLLLFPERLSRNASIPIVEDLQRRLFANEKENNTSTTAHRLVQVEGYVTAKRAFGSSFCFLDLVQSPNCLQQQQPVQAMLKRQEFIGNHGDDKNNSSRAAIFFDGYMKSIVPGIQLEIIGHVTASRNPGSETLILIRSMRILGIPRNPQHVRILLQNVANHQLNALEIVNAIHASTVSTATPSAPDDATDVLATRPWWSTATQLVQTLQDEEKQQHNRIEKQQPFYRLAKEIVAHLHPLQQQQQGNDNGQQGEDFVTSREQSLTSGKKYASSLLPLAGLDIRRPPKEASMYANNNNKRQSDFTFDEQEKTSTVDSVQAVQQKFVQGRQCQASSSSHPITSIRAWVQNRRRFQNGITILEAVDTMDTSSNNHQGSTTMAFPNVDDFGNNGNGHRLKCVLHPDIFMLQMNNQTIASVYSQLLAPGSLVVLHGYLSPLSSPVSSSPSSLRPILWVTNVRLLRASWRPSVISYFLELIVEQQQRKENTTVFVNPQEAIQALEISDHELNDIVNSDLTQRQWAAAEISQKLQQGAAARMGTIDPQHMAILDSLHDIRRQYPVTPVHINAPRHEYNGNNNKSSSSAVDERQGTRWRRKKEPQLEWMTEQVRGVVESHPDYGTRPLRILDVGGGKGLLANRLADALGGNSSVEIHVIDVAHGAIKNGAMRSKRLALPVQYSVQDASTARIKGEVDVVVALHACGTLSDVALEHAVAHGAGFVICPCCFRSNPNLQIPPRSQNGQPISVQEWLGIHGNDGHGDYWNALASLAEVQGDIQLSQRAIHTICALRAAAFNRHSTETNKKRPIVHTEIKTFPVAFSTRNFCLVGTFS